MKKAAVIIGLVVISVSSCTSFFPVQEPPIYTPLPLTMTPDPCGPESISAEIEMIRGSLNEFQEVAFIATNTPRESLISPVMMLEEIRQNLISLVVPECVQDLKQGYSDYTASLLRYFSKLMNKSAAKIADIDLQNSETLWKIVETEYENVITNARLEFQPLTGTESVLLKEAEFGAIAINDGDKSVNVRAQPDLDAKIVSSLEPGVQAMVVGRTEKGDWIRVYVLGIYGWLFSETITLNVDMEKVVVVNPTP
ncbi:MAG: SH3 domain-containing protein [Pelolinea sp.]|nr:SH3 domain-containing protein [Pelolinea sp.]